GELEGLRRGRGQRQELADLVHLEPVRPPPVLEPAVRASPLRAGREPVHVAAVDARPLGQENGLTGGAPLDPAGGNRAVRTADALADGEVPVVTFEAGPAAPELRVSRVKIDEHAPAKPPRHRLQSQVPAQIHEKRGLVGPSEHLVPLGTLDPLSLSLKQRRLALEPEAPRHGLEPLGRPTVRRGERLDEVDVALEPLETEYPAEAGPGRSCVARFVRERPADDHGWHLLHGLNEEALGGAAVQLDEVRYPAARLPVLALHDPRETRPDEEILDEVRGEQHPGVPVPEHVRDELATERPLVGIGNLKIADVTLAVRFDALVEVGKHEPQNAARF